MVQRGKALDFVERIAIGLYIPLPGFLDDKPLVVKYPNQVITIVSFALGTKVTTLPRLPLGRFPFT